MEIEVFSQFVGNIANSTVSTAAQFQMIGIAFLVAVLLCVGLELKDRKKSE